MTQLGTTRELRPASVRAAQSARRPEQAAFVAPSIFLNSAPKFFPQAFRKAVRELENTTRAPDKAVDTYGLLNFPVVDNPSKPPCHTPEAEYGKLIISQAAKNLKDKFIGQSVDGAVVHVVHMGSYQGVCPSGSPFSQAEGHLPGVRVVVVFEFLFNLLTCAGHVLFVDLFCCVLGLGRIRFVHLIVAASFVLCFDFSASTST